MGPDWRWRILGVTLALHILLIPAYRSTDFEVHRNWLAITYSLPLSRWYYEATSEWTLDYPPFFAWFEWSMSHFARLADPKMLAVSNLEYDSSATVVFQRLSVSLTGLVLAAAVLWGTRQHAHTAKGAALAFLVLCNAGLIMVDNIHFQYNSFLMGVLLWSIIAIEQQQDLLGGALFAVLLNLKHLFAYVAPVYFVYLLRHYCMGIGNNGNHTNHRQTSAAAVGSPQGKRSTVRPANSSGSAAQQWAGCLWRLTLLGGLVLAICAVAWWPFVALGQVPQVLSRLFPFGRGLTHAYWAPNAWALYSAADKVLAAGLSKLGLLPPPPTGHMAGGIVGVAPFLVLPQVGPKATAALVLLAQLPCLVALWRQPRPSRFGLAVAYANLCGFMWGYHVHEKAIITALLPMAWALATSEDLHPSSFVLLSSAGHVGMFPLLYQLAEIPVRWVLALVYYVGSMWAVPAVSSSGAAAAAAAAASRRGKPRQETSISGSWADAGGLLPAWLRMPVKLYLVGLVLLEAYCSMGHQVLLQGRLPFLPLLLTSTYCAVGVSWVWAQLCCMYARQCWAGGSHSSSLKGVQTRASSRSAEQQASKQD